MSTVVDKKTEKAPKSKSQASRDDDYIPRPDRSKFLDELNKYRAQLDGYRATLNKHKQAIEADESGANQTPEETKLREEHSALLAERSRLKDEEKKITGEAQKLEDSVRAKVAELQHLRPKSGPRSAKDVDDQIAKLEAQVEQDNISITAERQTIKEITLLRKKRASLARADELQSEIDEVRKKAADIRSNVDAAAIRQVQASKAELEKKLDKYKQERQANRTKLNSSYDARRETHAAIKVVNAKMDGLRKNFDNQMNTFNEKLKARKEQREKDEADAKVQVVQQKKISDAEAKVAAAREPAYASHIAKAKSLLAYFDPSTKTDDAPAAANTTSASAPDSLNNRPGSKVVSKAPAATGRTIQPTVSTAPPSRKSQKLKNKDTSSGPSLRMDINIIDALSTLNLSLPTTPEQIEATKKELNEKIKFYQDNSDRVTKERVERAEADLKKVREQANAEKTE